MGLPLVTNHLTNFMFFKGLVGIGMNIYKLLVG